MASYTTAERTARSSVAAVHTGFACHETPALRCAQNVAAPLYWSSPHAAAHAMTPPRPMPTPVVMTPLSTGSTSMMSASSGAHAQRLAGMVRARQQLPPRYSLENEEGKLGSSPPCSASVPTAAVPVTSIPVPQYYAVARGRHVGVYTSIAEVHAEIDGYDNHVYRVCATPQEAERFIDRYLEITHGRRSDPDPRHRSTLVAFCDGATQGTRNWSHQTGVACVFPHNSTWDIVYTCLDAYCTAYRATAKAALAAIKRANVENPGQDHVLYIYTRNQLLVRAMTEWMDTWRQHDWHKGESEPIKNRDVLQSIIDTQGKRRVIWRLADPWASEWTASVVSAAEDASIEVGELMDAHCI